MDLQAIRAAVEAIARAAGAAAMQFYDQPHQETLKDTIYDVVTEGDKASEAVIVRLLREQFPQYPILSEEGGGAGGARDGDYFWHVDPIDGTTNYANNIPFFSISIALAARNLAPVVGVVYNPVYDELYSAARGFGATFNGRAIHVTQTVDLSRAVLGSGFTTHRHAVADNNLPQWSTMLMEVRDLRRFGSAALDLAFVAAGKLDGFWETRLNSWDCLAGILLVQEAGGTTTDYLGGTAQLYSGREVVATNGQIHNRVLSILNHPD